MVRLDLDPVPGDGLEGREQVGDGAAALATAPIEKIAERLLDRGDLDQVGEAAQRGRVPPAMDEGRGDGADLAVTGGHRPGLDRSEGQFLQRIMPGQPLQVAATIRLQAGREG